MANKQAFPADKPIKVTEPPKIPTLSLNFKRPSIFSSNKNAMPKSAQTGRFNQSTFHTQHKGGTSGGK
ncbi:MAG: hypothetical protein ABSE04_02590 [Candidatus Microgenomates bacterium]